MDAPSVSIAREGACHVVTLNRPEKLNAFNDDMHARLAKALTDAAADRDCRCIVLTGAGRGFCTGQDLAERLKLIEAGPPDLTRGLEQRYNPLVRLIRDLPIPVIAAVNGVAAGAGANLALACDIVIAARSARFVQSFANIGLVPDCGGTYHLPRLVGAARARALALLAEPLSAETAAEWGMIWKAVDDADLMDEARAIATALAGKPARGLALIKKAFAASAGNDLDRQLDLERDLQGEAGRAPDYAEGVRAFLEKRKPNFSGRGSDDGR
ncbi:MAG: 2-(1,2-epoxy-1,2-dihydrophenyl)acetyl-CoA isomerase [Hyphomicrobiales bacterium]|nr:2-(1,2-epoxy-1,2-dihydrophenyl)acetyl-CoA isomerase [Hyphomicrobiales bacterium]